jgi:MprA protease rhombosortase-interaction domain-containing protein
MWDVLSDPQAFGPIMGAVILAAAGLLGYGRQKKADRQSDLVKLRQREYERYLRAFQEASRYKGVDDQKHAAAEAEYHDAQHFMLLHASPKVIKAVNAAHRYYVETDYLDWRTFKRLYAKMILAMRNDGYSPIRWWSAKRLADEIPWTIGDEPEARQAMRRAQQPSESE